MNPAKATAHVLLLLAPVLALAQASLEVIELRHTTAEQVLPALRPLLEPGGVLTGQRSRLIVRTSPRNLEELRRALVSLDAPRRLLSISVRHDSEGRAGETAARVDARLSDRGGRAALRAAQAHSESGERVDQRIQVLEGARAYIADGEARPLQLRDGVLVRESATGFEVVPRVSGDWVVLEIAPQRQSGGVLPGSVNAVAAATTVRTRLGEWVELAVIESVAAREDRAIASGSGRRDAQRRAVWIRVDEVRP